MILKNGLNFRSSSRSFWDFELIYGDPLFSSNLILFQLPLCGPLLWKIRILRNITPRHFGEFFKTNIMFKSSYYLVKCWRSSFHFTISFSECFTTRVTSTKIRVLRKAAFLFWVYVGLILISFYSKEKKCLFVMHLYSQSFL